MNICVYGASSTRIDESFILDGEKLGREMGKREINLVFGGGASGLMGAVARGVHEINKSKIIGIAPAFFDVDGILYDNCTEFHYPETMRERKRMMDEKSDAFIITPGGIGTFDEFFEILTLKQLSIHNKAIAILNTNHYYDYLMDILQNAINNGFMYEKCLKLFFVSDDCNEILDYLENYVPLEEPVSKFKAIK